MSQAIVLTTPEELAVIIENAVAARNSEISPEIVRLEWLKRRETLTTEQVEELYGLNAYTLKKRRMDGEGPAYIKDGDKVFYTHAAIKKYLESRRQKTNDQP
jgi:DNA polymerase III alpha subunit (gram-positive type)